MTEAHRTLLSKIRTYCEARPDIRCLALIGSQSGKAEFADEFSDLDLLIVSTDCTPYFLEEDWLSAIDQSWLSFSEAVPEANHRERRAVFSGGLDADFVLADAALLAETSEAFPILREICAAGVDVLIDKDDFGALLRSLVHAPGPFTFPTEAAYRNVVQDFGFHVLWAAKKLLRGEKWTAQRCLSGYLMRHLLTLLEWEAHARHGAEWRTFYEGRHLAIWLDPDRQRRLDDLAAPWDPAGMEQALRNTCALFSEVASSVADSQGFHFPSKAFQEIMVWLDAHPAVGR